MVQLSLFQMVCTVPFILLYRFPILFAGDDTFSWGGGVHFTFNYSTTKMESLNVQTGMMGFYYNLNFPIKTSEKNKFWLWVYLKSMELVLLSPLLLQCIWQWRHQSKSDVNHSFVKRKGFSYHYPSNRLEPMMFQAVFVFFSTFLHQQEYNRMRCWC